MLDRLMRRGPDGEGRRQLGHAWLGHRRLAISDVEGGEQPLHEPERDLWLVGDGEIYNHDRLRSELQARGHGFRTGSEHETALHFLADQGPDALERLWGRFVFVLAGEDGRFLACRDTLGIAPLYWTPDADTMVFASELKAFDPARCSQVKPFPPGHYWTPGTGLVAFQSLRDVQPETSLPAGGEADDESQPSEKVLASIRDRLITAVQRCMVREVPVGTLLSGGLDSSIVTAIAARVAERHGRQLPTFSGGLADSDDLAAARHLASSLGTEHHERIYTEDELIDWVVEVVGVIESFDPQLVHSSVPNLLVNKLASRHVKVVLIGEGADELFAGYHHYGEVESAQELHDRLVATLKGLHAGGMHRVDRIAAACSLEARIPYLDIEVVGLAMGLPAQWKLTTERPEKWLLRQAFEGWLPDELLWRDKAQFGQGSGARDVLREHYENTVTPEEFERERDAIEPPLRTREELAYFRMFERHFRGIDPAVVLDRFVQA
ncbi:MAG: asparagine synthase (glutamine-hydrolyzing) [Actinomycetota bacterium]|nr:asparagine synthase (glutamine-hydrolyzing) [Actinomycetota bacterium]